MSPDGLPPLPPSVAALDPAARQALADAYADARRQQQRQLEQARDHALRILPLPLRGVAKRIIG